LIGSTSALVANRYFESFLFGIRPTDSLMMIAARLLLIGVALTASYLPARRAAKVDPMVALRYE
jgi:putative ABC transport system permease protein